jgi:GNAT superfamily N-acetyltransferase
MELHRTIDSAEFADVALPFLSRDPVRHTILLTVVENERLNPSAGSWFAWVRDDGEVVGAALRTPPYNVALSTMPPDVAAALGADDRSPGAVGSRDVVEAFAGDRSLNIYMEEKQYVLTDLIAPPPPPGAARRYQAGDADLYVQWLKAFVAETGVTDAGDALLGLESRLRTGGAMWLWEVDGEPVAMAGRSTLVCGVPRVGPVWTPPEQRRNGYAAAITAHVCAEAFAVGATACTLFTDAANATSNGVYERLGFRLVGEIIDARFPTLEADVS